MAQGIDLYRGRKYRAYVAPDGAICIGEHCGDHGKRVYRGRAESFIYGTRHYDERTARFPDYIHREVWALAEFERQRAAVRSQAGGTWQERRLAREHARQWRLHSAGWIEHTAASAG